MLVDISQESEKEAKNLYDNYPMIFVPEVTMKNNPL
jgi:hypothetical protein